MSRLDAMIRGGITALICLLAGLVQASEQAQDIAYLRLTDNIWQVWVTDETGSKHRQITFDDVDKARVSWSPDRRQILCNRNDGTLIFVDVKSGQSETLPLDALGVYDAQWSPDGKRIAFTATTSLQADNAEVWVANLDGSGKQKITDHIAVALTPAWDIKTGSVLYSAGKPGQNQEIWSVNPQSGHSEQITISKSSSVDPSTNQQGELLYSSDREGNYNIWMLDNSKKPKKLTQSDAYNAQPSWSPDGKKMVFYRLKGNQRRLWVQDLGTGAEHPITPADSFSRYPAWIR